MVIFSSLLGHVAELSNNTDKYITIKITTSRSIKQEHIIPAQGLITINAHKLLRWLSPDKNFQLEVYLNNDEILDLKLILPLKFLLEFVRITFENSDNDENLSLTATGLQQLPADFFYRIRFLKKWRREEFSRREEIAALVHRNLGKPMNEGTQTTQRSENIAFGIVSIQANGMLEEISVARPTVELNNDDSGPNVVNLLSPLLLSSSNDISNHPLEQNNAGERLQGQQRDPSSDLMYLEAPMEEGVSGEVAQISNSDTNEKLKKFEYTLIGYIPEEGSFDSNSIKERDEFSQCRTITVLKDGFFALEFSCLDDIMEVLEHGQLFIDEDKPIILKRWSPNLVFERSRFLSSQPIWVQLFNINWANWTDKYLCKVCKNIGEFLFMDKDTSEHKRLAYARVCVGIDPYKELPDIIHVLEHDDDDKTIPIPVTYEWKPQISSRREDSNEELNSSGIAGDQGGGAYDRMWRILITYFSQFRRSNQYTIERSTSVY